MKKCFLNNFYFCNKSHLTIKQSVYNKRHEIKKALAYQVIEKNRDYKSIGILIKKRMVFKMKKLDVYLSNLLVGNVKLHNLHWNVVGSSFKQAHEYLEEVYDDFFGKFDDVAEELLQEFYPEGLKQPAPIPIRVIADIMGLAIREIRLTKFMNELVHLHHTWHIEIKSIMDMN